MEKQRLIKIYLTAGIVIFAIGAILLSINLFNTNEPEQSTEPHQTGKLEQSEDILDSADTEQSAEPVNFRKFDERTVEITKYETFYRDSSFLFKGRS